MKSFQDAGSVARRQLRDLTHCDNNIEALKKEIQKLALAKERLLKKIDAAKRNCSLLFDAAGRQLGYMLHYSNNIATLKDEIQKLVRAKERLLKNIDAAKGNCQDIFFDFDVEIWLAEVEEISAAIKMFLEDEVSANNRCINPRQCYRFSKEAKKQTVVISNLLLEAGKFEDAMSSPATLPEISASLGFSGILESRESIKKDIMAALLDENLRRIGICGLAGVGKTTLVKEIGEEVEESMLFDKVGMVVVSKTPVIKNIQGEISNMLGLRLPDGSGRERSEYLRQQGIEGKLILIILDNVRETIDLFEIGIDRNYKVVIISPSKSVCERMDCGKIFTVETLSKQESWELFTNLAGLNVENSDINLVAREVASKCRGLPIATVTIARALKNKEKRVWNDAIKQLIKSSTTNIEGIQGSVFSSLERSYSYLESEVAKSLFLFCSLFPANIKIPVEVLVRYGVGLRWFENFCILEDARDRAQNVVSILTSSFLLIDDHDDEYGKCVKIHDVIRDFAIIIAPKYNRKFMVEAGDSFRGWPSRDTCEAISLISCDIGKISEELDFPNLQALLLQPTRKLVVPNSFFLGMKDLKVLDLSQTTLMPLPDSLSSLAKLRTLYLEYCKLDDLSLIGKLNNLEILSFCGSDIKEIPISFRQLSHLRLLDLSKCKQLEVIPQEVISCLSKLEELYMIESFEHWDFEGKGDSRSNARLVELQFLPLLTSLQIYIPDPNMLPYKNMSFLFQFLINFTLVIGHGDFYYRHKSRYSRNMILLHMSISKTHCWIKEFLKRTENLYVRQFENSKNILHGLFSDGSNKLKSLLIESCEINYLFNTVEWTPKLTFHNLEELKLYNNSKLVEICHGQPLIQSFSKLKSLDVEDCKSILNIFDFQGLEIANGEKKMLSSLEDLTLADLPEMTQIWKSNHQFISLCNLKRVALKKCLKLMKLFSFVLLQGLISLENIELESCYKLEEIFEQREAEDQKKGIDWNKDCSVASPSLGNLTYICISDCFELKYLFTPSIVKSLAKLRVVRLHCCSKMQELVTNEEGEKGASTKRIVFPSLYLMELQILSNLTCFISLGLYTVEFPVLETLKIHHCHRLKALFYKDQVTLPKLTTTQQVPNKQIYDKSNLVNDICHGQPPAQSFCKLKHLYVEYCNSMYIIPSYVLQGLQNIETLKVKHCELVVFIFDLEGLEIANGETNVLSSLKYLELENLPKMMQIWKGDHQLISLCNLKNDIEYCSNLEEIFKKKETGDKEKEIVLWKRDRTKISPNLGNLIKISIRRCDELKSLFTPSIVKSLVKLQTLNLDGCLSMQAVVTDEKEGREESAERILVFPSLEGISLGNLNNLTCFSSRLYATEFPVLTKLRIDKCPKVLPNVNGIMQIYDNPSLVDISHGQPLPQSFGKLDWLHVSSCHSMLYIIPTYLAQRLQSLRRLNVENCESVVCIFDLEGLEIANRETTVLSSLEYLELKDLAQMTQIWKCNHQFISLTKLEIVILKTCPKLIKLFSPALLPSLIRLWLVEIRRCSDLEEIFEAEDQEKGIVAWKKDNTTISSPSLGNLTCIFIHDCGKLKYLFTFSIGKSLVNLVILQLYGCSAIQEIITNKEEEKGVSTVGRMEFPSLVQVELGDLNNLTCFSSGSYAIEFPALENLRIFKCPKMKTFCSGDQLTPKLNQVYVASVDPDVQDPFGSRHNPEEKRWRGNLKATVEEIFKEEEQKAKLEGEETEKQKARSEEEEEEEKEKEKEEEKEEEEEKGEEKQKEEEEEE